MMSAIPDAVTINVSVTVLPVLMLNPGPNQTDTLVGFLRRGLDESFPDKLVAPGGKVEPEDGDPIIDGVPYSVLEATAKRELLEETGLELDAHRWRTGSLRYLTSLRLPKYNRIVVCFYARVYKGQEGYNGKLEFYTLEEIRKRHDFAPGTKAEAFMLFDALRTED